MARVGENPLVRKIINNQLRTMASKGGVVMIGRDIGTEVLPNSETKIYLDASLEVRAKRRFRDAMNQGKKISYDEILCDMEQRDQLDSSRPTAPMMPAKDAIIINTDNLSFEETLNTILGFVGNKSK